ncbi:hypothetical protein ESZ50_04890 [Weissella muntiaci]|uniref:Uncharacterized protein n=1 Tax=Weissella muntiaci TaxID=2508881 RepID=A0A6C2C8N0_9LACO|nr:hypothetical protein [Weissella muntiaci]TYC49929.1 hypothetical protein ESZ50_04890 [Weissella muntiaci]
MSKEELLLKQLTDAISAGVDKMTPVAQEYVHQFVVSQSVGAFFCGILTVATAWLTVFFFKQGHKNSQRILETDRYSNERDILDSKRTCYNVAIGVTTFVALVSFCLFASDVANALAPLPAIISSLN